MEIPRVCLVVIDLLHCTSACRHQRMATIGTPYVFPFNGQPIIPPPKMCSFRLCFRQLSVRFFGILGIPRHPTPLVLWLQSTRHTETCQLCKFQTHTPRYRAGLTCPKFSTPHGRPFVCRKTLPPSNSFVSRVSSRLDPAIIFFTH